MTVHPILWTLSWAAGIGLCASLWAQPNLSPAKRTPESRALAYLAREVPLWRKENKCYSCHNNGDGARALYTAIRLKERVPTKVVTDTTAWLAKPEGWKHNGGEGVFSDKKLAAIQFGASLVAAIEARQTKDTRPLISAAEMVAGFQEKNGSWLVDEQGQIGSPTTYGQFLATTVSRNILKTAGGKQFAERIARADRWLRNAKPKTVLDSAAVILGLENAIDPPARQQREHCLEVIRKGESETGGWGPYVTSASEPFDTAVVLIALAQLEKRPAEMKRMIAGGRRFLIKDQLDDGSWIETTRPAESESYPQRISTVAWATIALLKTRPRSVSP